MTRAARRPTLDLSLGARLRERRTAAGITQVDLARDVGVGRFMVWEIEQGIVRYPDAVERIERRLTEAEASPCPVPPPPPQSTSGSIPTLLLRAETESDVLAILKLAHASGLTLTTIIGEAA